LTEFSVETNQKYKYYKILLFGVQIMALQIRRGTDAERLEITPLQGELIFTTDNKEVFVGDGTTVGGIGITGSGGGGSGTVTTVSVTTANGFAGTVTNPTTAPAISMSTTVSGILKGNGTAVSAASAGTDFQAPITLTTSGSSGAATLIGNTLNVPQYSGGVGATALSDLTDVNLGSLSPDQVLTWNGTSWINQATSAGLASVSEDTTPALGGNLDLNTYDITGTGNIDITCDIIATTISADLGGDLGLNTYDITGTGNINITGDIIATTISADLGGDLGLNTYNIDGTGDINITGNITADNITVSTSVFGPFGVTLIDAVQNTVLADIVNDNTTTGLLRVDHIALDQNLATGGISILTEGNTLNDDYDLFNITTANSSTNGNFASFNKSRGTINVPTALQPNDGIFALLFSGQSTVGMYPAASIRASVDGSVGAFTPGLLAFRTADNLGNNTTRLTINSKGTTILSGMMQLATFADETAATAAVGGTPVNGMMYYDLGDEYFKGYQDGAWVVLQP
jgi:hypothetical protein